MCLVRDRGMRKGAKGQGMATGKARLRAALAAYKEFFFNLAVKQRATIAPKSCIHIYINSYVHTNKCCNCETN